MGVVQGHAGEQTLKGNFVTQLAYSSAQEARGWQCAIGTTPVDWSRKGFELRAWVFLFCRNVGLFLLLLFVVQTHCFWS